MLLRRGRGSCIKRPLTRAELERWNQVRYSPHLLLLPAFLPQRLFSPRGDDCQTDEDLDNFIRHNAKTDYHPSCTCKMGSEDDPTAVVDNEAHVIGVENLRVVDASIMPSIVSGNLNAPPVIIAEKAADMILLKCVVIKNYVKTCNLGDWSKRYTCRHVCCCTHLYEIILLTRDYNWWLPIVDVGFGQFCSRDFSFWQAKMWLVIVCSNWPVV